MTLQHDILSFFKVELLLFSFIYFFFDKNLTCLASLFYSLIDLLSANREFIRVETPTLHTIPDSETTSVLNWFSYNTDRRERERGEH